MPRVRALEGREAGWLTRVVQETRRQTDLPVLVSLARFLDQSLLRKKLRIFSEASDRACLADLFFS